MLAAALNSEQRVAYDRIIAGENLFITGPGGVGKSHLIRAIVAKYNTMDGRCSVTALTGCAAILLNCGAKTLHAWAGIKLGKETAEVLVERVTANRRAMQRWRTTDLLIIDEVSMLLPDLMRKLDIVGQKVRRCDRPFGGMQLVFTGDFCQLPPIHKDWVDTMKSVDVSRRKPFFAFEDPLWHILFPSGHTIVLAQNMRQRNDVRFQTVLDAVRFGRCGPAEQAIIRSAMRPLPEVLTTLGIRPTVVFSIRADAEKLNLDEMAKLTGTRRTYTATTSAPPTVPRTQMLHDVVDRFDEDAQYEPIVEMAVGAQVMLVFNLDIDAGLANGSRGVVVGFTNEPQFGGVAPSGATAAASQRVKEENSIVPVVRFVACPDKPVIVERAVWELNHPDFPGVTRSQIPLRIAYGITIHKAQGATLDCAAIDIGARVFEFGQAYVALSRVRSLDTLQVLDFAPAGIRAHPRVVEFYEGLAAEAADVSADVVAEEEETTEEDPV